MVTFIPLVVVPSPKFHPLLSGRGLEVLLKLISWSIQAVSGALNEEVIVELRISIVFVKLSLQPAELDVVRVTS